MQKTSREKFIFSTSCDAWVNKKCSGIKDRLIDITYFKCHICLGLAHPADGRPVEHVSLGDQKLEVVESFIFEMEYPPKGGCEVSIIARIRYTWGKFRELLPLLTNQEFP